jgi:hypothetical protein
LNYITYHPKAAQVEAVVIETPPRRMTITSSVYDYETISFVAPGMPVVGDYLIRKTDTLYEWKSKALFEALYEKA